MNIQTVYATIRSLVPKETFDRLLLLDAKISSTGHMSKQQEYDYVMLVQNVVDKLHKTNPEIYAVAKETFYKEFAFYLGYPTWTSWSLSLQDLFSE